MKDNTYLFLLIYKITSISYKYCDVFNHLLPQSKTKPVNSQSLFATINEQFNDKK